MDNEENKVNMDENMGGTEPSGGSAGPVIGVIVILVIIILGGLYFWGQNADDEALLNDEVIESIETQSGSDELDAIEADLDATDVENIDAEINAS